MFSLSNSFLLISQIKHLSDNSYYFRLFFARISASASINSPKTRLSEMITISRKKAKSIAYSCQVRFTEPAESGYISNYVSIALLGRDPINVSKVFLTDFSCTA